MLIENISQRILNRLTKNRTFSRVDYLKCKLGLETILIDAAKLIVIYGLATVVGLLWQVSLFHIGYMGIRLFAHGVHCKTNLECTLVSCFMLVGTTALINTVQLPIASVFVMFFINLIFLWNYAPSATKKNGIGNSSDAKKKKLRYKSLIVNVIIFVMSLLMPVLIGMLIMTGAIMAGFMTTPLAYKLFREERI